MAGILKRLLNVAIAQDEAANAVFGGDPRQTISGTVGRALGKGALWAKPAAAVIDGLFGQGHCLRQAAREAAHDSQGASTP